MSEVGVLAHIAMAQNFDNRYEPPKLSFQVSPIAAPTHVKKQSHQPHCNPLLVIFDTVGSNSHSGLQRLGNKAVSLAAYLGMAIVGTEDRR
jgi:hypothetical protein